MATAEHLDDDRLQGLRAALEAERSELLGQVEELDAEADITRWRDGGFDDDPADTGSAATERERAQSLSHHARRMLVQIDDAMKRIERGAYGVCQRCQGEIPYERLEAVPYAEYCMACRRLEEQGR